MEFQQTTLSNGMKVIAETNESALSASLGFFVRTGSRNETPEISGVSHFLEHMIFKGSETRSATDVNWQLDEMGADANAFTMEEQTVFYASLLPELIEDAVELFCDILRPALREDDFEMERQVILEEISMYEDQPPFGADDKSRELFFGDHPLGNSVLGSIDSVSGLTTDRMRQYVQDRYRPDNVVLVGAGRLNFEHFVAQAEKSTWHWSKPSTSGNISWSGDDSSAKDGDVLRRVRGQRGFHHLIKDGAAQQHTMLLFDSPGAMDEDRFAAGLLANMIGDDIGSRLYWELVDSGLADYAGLGTCEFYDNGFFALSLSSEPEDAVEVLARTRKLFRTVMQHGLTLEELDRSRNKILSRLVLANERPGGRLFSLGGEWTIRNEYRTVRQDLDDLRRVGAEDIQNLLQKYSFEEPLLVSIGPLKHFDGAAIWNEN